MFLLGLVVDRAGRNGKKREGVGRNVKKCVGVGKNRKKREGMGLNGKSRKVIKNGKEQKRVGRRWKEWVGMVISGLDRVIVCLGRLKVNSLPTVNLTHQF